jgi:hypothetical protein
MTTVKIRSMASYSCKTVLALALTVGCAHEASSQPPRVDDSAAEIAATEAASGDAGAADAAATATRESKADIRKLVKEGKMNACVTDEATRVANQPRLVFHNTCDVQVNVSLCVRVQGQPKSYFLILMSKKSEAQQVLWIADGVHYDYLYNSCDKPYCTPPEADC